MFVLIMKYLLIAAALVGADQLTKGLICPRVIESGTQLFIPHLIRFEYVENTGMAWGMLKNASVILAVVSSAACVFIAYILIREHKKLSIGIRAGLIVVLSGALGNLVDRFFLGYVRDFIAFDFINFPVFNPADCFVTVGAAILLISLIFTKAGRRTFSELMEDDKKKK